MLAFFIRLVIGPFHPTLNGPSHPALTAKSEIYSIMRKLTDAGMSIIMISSEMAEIQKISDRVIFMHEGSVTGEFRAKDATQTAIMDAAIGLKK